MPNQNISHKPWSEDYCFIDRSVRNKRGTVRGCFSGRGDRGRWKHGLPQRGKFGRSGRGNLHHIDDLDRMNYVELASAVGKELADDWEKEENVSQTCFDEFGFPIVNEGAEEGT